MRDRVMQVDNTDSDYHEYNILLRDAAQSLEILSNAARRKTVIS